MMSITVSAANITMGDDEWIGIGSTSERIVFDSDGDDIEMLGADVGIGIASPTHKVHIVDTDYTDDRAGLYIDQAGGMSGTGYGIYVSKTGASVKNVAGRLSVSGGTNNFGAEIYSTGSATFNVGADIAASDATTTWGLRSSASGTGTTNIAGIFTASGATNNYGLIVSNGEVGIGTASPIETLDVNGGIKVGSAINTNAGTIQWTGTDFQGHDGTSWVSLTGASYWTQSGFDIYYTTGNVGIGTSSPTGALHVDGGRARASTSGTDISLIAQDAGTGNMNGGSVWLEPGVKSGTGNDGFVHVVGNLGVSGWMSQDGDDEGLIVDSAGQVGIMKSTPICVLEINTGSPSGTVGIGQFSLTNELFGQLSVKNSDSAVGSSGFNGYGGYKEVWSDGGNDDAMYIMNIGHSTGSTQATNDGHMTFGWWDNQMTPVRHDYVTILNDYGNVGIGTTSPDTKLHVDGDVTLGEGNELTMSSDAVTVTHSYHPIDTEGDLSSDNLWTISGGDVAGQVLIIRAEYTGRVIHVKDDTGPGNLKLNGDFSLDNVEDSLMLIYDGSDWLEISRSDNG